MTADISMKTFQDLVRNSKEYATDLAKRFEPTISVSQAPQDQDGFPDYQVTITYLVPSQNLIGGDYVGETK